MSIAAVGLGMRFLGGLSSSRSKKRAARLAKERGREQNRYNKIAAIQTEASGQISAREENRRAELIASRAVAVAAAGGYSDDVTNLIADIEGEGNYRASIALFDAGTEAERLRHEGRMAEKYGLAQSSALQTQARNTTLSAFGGLATGIGKLYATAP